MSRHPSVGSSKSTLSWDPPQQAADIVNFSQQNMSSQPNSPNALDQQQLLYRMMNNDPQQCRGKRRS